MPKLETYKKQAKLLVRWHREGNHSIGGRIRKLQRYRTVTDHEALALKFPLSEAQEIIAVEEGFADWAELKATVAEAQPVGDQPESSDVIITAAMPVLFVADVDVSAKFYQECLGFTIDFLHGHPPFYGSVSREGATLHLKFVHEPVFAADAVQREGLIMAYIEAPNVKQLYAEYVDAGVEIVQKLTKQAWGGTDFHVGDPDGNTIAFVG